MIVAQGADFIRVKVGRRTVTVAGAASPEGPDGPDFVVMLDSITQWDPPHESEALTLEDLGRITQLIETAYEARGLSVEFE